MNAAPRKPKTYASDLAHLPPALAPLTRQPRWVLWRWELRNGRWTKPPLQRNGDYAKNNDPATWCTYADALGAIGAIKADGIGYMLLNDDLHLAANDLDDCRDASTGNVAPWAQTYLDRANGAYVEISPSGTGFRIIGTSDKPAMHNKFPINGAGDRAAIEVYRNIETGRYITITGMVANNFTALTNIDPLIDSIIAEQSGNGANPDRSATFHAEVWKLAEQGLDVAKIESRLRQHSDGIADKYLKPTDRLRREIERSYRKWEHQHQPPPSVLCGDRASEYEMEAVEWLWQWRIAKGALNLLAGLPDQGKGLTWCDVVARISRGAEWPAGEGRAPQGNVIIFSAEDDIRRTIVPRLVAAGADLDRVHIVEMTRNADGTERMFNLLTDLPALKAKIEEVSHVALVIIDPVSAYLGVGKISGGSSTDVRGVLSPLTKLAEEKQVAILAVMHFNKKVDITNAILRIADSLAYAAAARSIYIAVEDPANEGAHLFIKAKGNLAPSNLTALRYMIGVRNVGFDQKLEKPIDAPFVLWDNNPVKITAMEAMEAAKRGNAKDEAKNFLQSRLALGRVKADDIYEEAKARCIAVATIRRAKRELNIVSEKERGSTSGEWCWRLPTPEGAQEGE
jgi:putative DNA primase/helicase